MTDFTIGEFARRCHLPISTLRYYDQIGLLRPAIVDAATGYRRYRVDQLRTAVLIFQLRSIGVSPGSIAQIVAGGLGASAGLIAERRRIESEIAQRRWSLDHIDEFLHGGRAENYQVDVVELVPRQVPARPFLISLIDLEAGLFTRPSRRSKRSGGSATQPIVEEYLGLDNAAAPVGPIQVHVPYDLDMSQS